MSTPWLRRPSNADRGPSGKKSLERLMAFSDAVVAIAITLIVLPLVDHAMDADGAANFFQENLVGLASAALSSVIIALFWRGHHYLFADATGYTPGVLRLEFVWLAAIVFLPVATALEFGDQEGSGLTAASYAAALLVASVAARAQRALLERAGLHPVTPRSFVDRWLGSILIALALVMMLVVPAGGAGWLFLLVLEPVLRRIFGR